MTKDEKFQIGLALNKIALMLNDDDFQRVKEHLKQIERIVAEQTEPQTDFGEYADRLWKIAYERGKREALEQTETSDGERGE